MKTILSLLQHGIIGTSFFAILVSILTFAVLGDVPVWPVLFSLFFTLIGVGGFLNLSSWLRYWWIGFYLIGLVCLLTKAIPWFAVGAGFIVLAGVVTLIYWIDQRNFNL